MGGVSDHSLSRDREPNHSRSQWGPPGLSNVGLTKHEVTFPLPEVAGLFEFMTEFTPGLVSEKGPVRPSSIAIHRESETRERPII